MTRANTRVDIMTGSGSPAICVVCHRPMTPWNLADEIILEHLQPAHERVLTEAVEVLTAIGAELLNETADGYLLWA